MCIDDLKLMSTVFVAFGAFARAFAWKSVGMRKPVEDGADKVRA